MIHFTHRSMGIGKDIYRLFSCHYNIGIGRSIPLMNETIVRFPDGLNHRNIGAKMYALAQEKRATQIEVPETIGILLIANGFISEKVIQNVREEEGKVIFPGVEVKSREEILPCSAEEAQRRREEIYNFQTRFIDIVVRASPSPFTCLDRDGNPI